MIPGIVQPKGFPGLPEGWSHQFETFPSSDGNTKLFGAQYRNTRALASLNGRAPRAFLLLHGMGDHGGRYVHAAHYLQNEIDILYCLDQRGHGRSEGLRGHIEHFDSLADDLALAIRRLEESLRREFGSAKVHALGHSMGGHVMLRALLNHPEMPLESASVSAPFLAIKQPVPIAKKLGARVLNHIWGQLQLETGLSLDWLSRDPAVVESYRTDRLNHDKMTPRFYSQMSEAWKDTLSRHDGIRVPLQFLVPMADLIVDPETTLRYYEALNHPDKRLRKFEEFYHEPLNEPGKERVFADIGEWIRTHSG